MPVSSPQSDAIHILGIISVGLLLPPDFNMDIIMVGISWIDVVFRMTNITISRLAESAAV